MSTHTWTNWTSASLVILILLIPISVLVLNSQQLPLVAWLGTLALLTAFTIQSGYALTGRLAGAIIDARNVMSLSRFQMVSWTLVILSGFLTAALLRVFNGDANPIEIKVQGELWALMGISTASLIGSPLLLSNKAAHKANSAEQTRTFNLLTNQGDTDKTLGTSGQLVINTDPSNARFSDMLTGEEVGNAAHLDVSRLQMLFFTIVAVIAYAVEFGSYFLVGDGLQIHKPDFSLPILDQSMITLIGISHGGYLLAKALPHSQPPDSAQTPPAPDADTNTPAMG